VVRSNFYQFKTLQEEDLYLNARQQFEQALEEAESPGAPRIQTRRITELHLLDNTKTPTGKNKDKDPYSFENFGMTMAQKIMKKPINEKEERT